MLQRRIGMIWTSSGCAVCVSPRTNSRTDRILRLAVVRALISGVRLQPERHPGGTTSGVRLGWAEPLDARSDLHRTAEERPNRDKTPQLMARNRREARRRHATAVGAVG